MTPTDIKVLFAEDDEEYEAIVGVTDTNLHLSFIIIKDLKGKELDLLASDFAKASVTADVKIGDRLIGVSRYNEGFDYAPYFGITRIAGKIEQPRPLLRGARRLR